jgi:hypothetical protein
VQVYLFKQSKAKGYVVVRRPPPDHWSNYDISCIMACNGKWCNEEKTYILPESEQKSFERLCTQ